MKSGLEQARSALERGRPKEALRLAWDAAMSAITGDDERAMAAAIDLAETIRDRATGRTREEAERLAVLVAYAREHPQERRILGVPMRR